MKSVCIQKGQLFASYYLIYYFTLVLIFILLAPTPCLSTSTNSGSPSPGNHNQPEERNESFFWKLYSRGKSYFFGRHDHFSSTNSSRRTGHHMYASPSQKYAASHQHIDDPAEHRIVNDGPFGDLDAENDEPERKENNAGTNSGWGWSWSPGHGHGPDHHMQLYTLLGGLSFASFLATAVIIMTRRNGTVLRSQRQGQSVANYLLNLNGNRKVDHLQKNSVQEQLQESQDKFVRVPEFVYKLSKIFSPWWYVLPKEEEEISFVPVKVTRVPEI